MVQISSWLYSTFQELSKEYSHAQIRVKIKKLWPRQVGEEKQAAVKKYVATGIVSRPVLRQEVCCDQCRDKQHVATSVTTSSMLRPVSRQAVCRDQCRDQEALSRQESFVATRNTEKPKNKPKIDILT